MSHPSSLTHPQHLVLSVVLFREHDTWVAAGLQHFVAAQGPTEEKARHAFACSVVAQILMDLKAKREPLAQLAPAPPAYWERFDRAIPTLVPIETPEAAPPAFLLEAILH